MDETLFEPVETVGGLASTSTATRVFQNPVRHVLLCNSGPSPVYYKLGASDVTISSLDSCDCVLPYSKELIGARGATAIAFRTESGTSRFSATAGFGEL